MAVDHTAGSSHLQYLTLAPSPDHPVDPHIWIRSMFLFTWRKANDRGKPGAGGGGGRSLAELEKEIERAKMLNKQLQEQVCHERISHLDVG